MRLLVFGASGKTGQHIVSQALEKGHTLTAFARDVFKIKIQHPNLKVFQGNVANYEKVELAMKDHDAVLSALGASSPFSFDQTVVNGLRNIVIAMEYTGINRLVYLSFIGVKESRGDAPFFIKYLAPAILKTEISGHEAREKIIEQCKLDWTIVRPGGLSNGAKKGLYRDGEDLKSGDFMVSISRADVADFMLRCLEEDLYNRKKPRIFY